MKRVLLKLSLIKLQSKVNVVQITVPENYSSGDYATMIGETN
jgi:hypothetical protein